MWIQPAKLMTNLPRAKQVTALSKALSHIQLHQFGGFFQHLDYNDVYEEAFLIHIRLHIFMNGVVFVLKAR